MKLHQFREHEPTTTLTLGFNRLRPLAASAATAAFDLKSFIRPESGSTKHESSDYPNRESTQAEAPAGGRRWNPTQEQLAMLETLYRGGMRTPTAEQIEHIASHLCSFGKIEGKNVFYWFQNHKARERQRQKRISLGLGCRTTASPFAAAAWCPVSCDSEKRKLRSWAFDRCAGEGEEGRTLRLFPLHPEGKS